MEPKRNLAGAPIGELLEALRGKIALAQQHADDVGQRIEYLNAAYDLIDELERRVAGDRSARPPQ